ncbi:MULTISPECIES: hypothetical protein [Flavobacterium]|uniref:Fibronectin type-III domain-containing protein n=1 Tax=Flavobacterium jumunjinense TaxID=998845 RepID=A0ABV5GJZ0_9FLAO|nr:MULTISPECIES: hypothetical protein [Flavobacterium]
MKKLLYVLIILNVLMVSCNINDENADASEVPPPRSYTTYISQNSVTLNGLIDNSNNYYQGEGTYKVGFIFRTGDINDSSNDQVILVNENVEYTHDKKYFSTIIDELEPSTKYFYTCFTKNGNYQEYDWEEFTTSATPCSYTQNNYISISGVWQSTSVQIYDPSCCDEGNFGIRFGGWPNNYELSFNELNNGYPKTGQYFGVNNAFDISGYNREILKSSNQLLIENNSTPETELFVVNNGTTLTFIFCNTILNNGKILNGKVSVAIP